MSTTLVSDKTEHDLITRTPTGLYVNGRWEEATAGAQFDVIDPSQGTVLARVAKDA